MTLGLVAIVRDEAPLVDLLLSQAPFDAVTVTDTGSADGTVDKIRHHGVEPAEVPWQNFGYNRSVALNLARGTADWLLMLDADMTVEWDEGWEPDPAADAYLVPVSAKGSSFTWHMPLLLR